MPISDYLNICIFRSSVILGTDNQELRNLFAIVVTYLETVSTTRHTREINASENLYIIFNEFFCKGHNLPEYVKPEYDL